MKPREDHIFFTKERSSTHRVKTLAGDTGGNTAIDTLPVNTTRSRPTGSRATRRRTSPIARTLLRRRSPKVAATGTSKRRNHEDAVRKLFRDPERRISQVDTYAVILGTPNRNPNLTLTFSANSTYRKKLERQTGRW